jgi:hypothetical protein
MMYGRCSFLITESLPSLGTLLSLLYTLFVMCVWGGGGEGAAGWAGGGIGVDWLGLAHCIGNLPV